MPDGSLVNEAAAIVSEPDARVSVTDEGNVIAYVEDPEPVMVKEAAETVPAAAGSVTPKNRAYHSVGLENTTCWQVHWADANNMWACFSDIRGLRSTDAGASWSFNYTGNAANSTYRVVEHPTTGTLFAG